MPLPIAILIGACIIAGSIRKEPKATIFAVVIVTATVVVRALFLPR
jgi:hypothetical protein